MPETVKNSVDIKLTDISRLRLADKGDPLATLNRQAIHDPTPSEAPRNYRVALIGMPFASTWRPLIALGLLKAIGQRAGFRVDDYYLNLELASRMGLRVYDKIGCVNGRLTGEWLFSVAAFGADSNRADYFEAFPEEASWIADKVGKDTEYLNQLRDHVFPDYIDECFHAVDWQVYNAVGFSSCFQQNVASLALARRIKEAYPDIAIIFGGANMEDEMGVELVRAFSFVDHVVVGEGDAVFPELLTRLADGRETDDLVGVASRCGDGISFIGPAAPIRDLDSLPTPDYSTYYTLVQRLGINTDPEFMREIAFIPFEGSRGCWWGEKQHCTFCGLNGLGMTYRSKAPGRTLSELDELNRKYGVKSFLATDNILDMKYINGLFEELGNGLRDYEFLFEAKANMTQEQVRILRKGGLRYVQPGIESLSTAILKLMRKGCTKLQNLTILKWCRYYEIDTTWNLLHGFPGEKAEDYADQLETMRLISHLQPPACCGRIWLERFSPVYHDEKLFPKKWQRPDASYGYVYPEFVNLEKIAYFFDYEVDNVLPEETHQETMDILESWQAQWHSGRRAALCYRRTESDLIIEDTRFGPDRRRTYTLVGPDADIYEGCSSAPRTAAQVCAALSSACAGRAPDEAFVAAACDTFCDAGLMIGEAGKYLSLAIPSTPYR